VPSRNPRGNRCSREKRIIGMLLIIAILLLLLWGGGFAFHVAGSLIHILLVIALVVFIFHFVTGGKSV
jgi:hypothetical protein